MESSPRAPGIPESFKVLVKELQALCLDIKVLDENGKEIELSEVYEDDTPVYTNLDEVNESADKAREADADESDEAYDEEISDDDDIFEEEYVYDGSDEDYDIDEE